MPSESSCQVYLVPPSMIVLSSTRESSCKSELLPCPGVTMSLPRYQLRFGQKLSGPYTMWPCILLPNLQGVPVLPLHHHHWVIWCGHLHGYHPWQLCMASQDSMQMAHLGILSVSIRAWCNCLGASGPLSSLIPLPPALYSLQTLGYAQLQLHEVLSWWSSSVSLSQTATHGPCLSNCLVAGERLGPL